MSKNRNQMKTKAKSRRFRQKRNTRKIRGSGASASVMKYIPSSTRSTLPPPPPTPTPIPSRFSTLRSTLRSTRPTRKSYLSYKEIRIIYGLYRKYVLSRDDEIKELIFQGKMMDYNLVCPEENLKNTKIEILNNIKDRRDVLIKDKIKILDFFRHIEYKTANDTCNMILKYNNINNPIEFYVNTDFNFENSLSEMAEKSELEQLQFMNSLEESNI